MASNTSTKRRGPRGISLWDPGHLLSLGLGTGLMPYAPGTWGSLLALPAYLTLNPHGPVPYVVAVVVLFAAGVYLSGRTARALGVHDDNAIVIDEVVGMMVTWVAVEPGWFSIAAGFVLFRLFDVLKPWPIYRFDRDLEGGLGIMLDDVAAGIMAAIVLQLLLHYAPAALVGA